MTHKTRGTPLSGEILTVLRALVMRVGVVEASRRTGVSTSAIRGALAGLPILHGTALAIEVGLRRGVQAS